MGIKACTCGDAHRLMYETVKSLYGTPETNITLYVNCTGIKIKNSMKKKYLTKIKEKYTLRNLEITTGWDRGSADPLVSWT